MKTFTIATIAALATVGTAQLSNIPQCALTCFVPALTSDGCKDLTDFKCHCEKGAELVGTVTPCVQGACSAADQATAIEAVQKTCAGVGVPINLPDPAGAASSAAAPVASSAAAVVSSAAEAASSAVASAVSSAAAAVSSAAAAPTGNTTLPSASVSAPLSTFTGAAAQATQAVGLLGAAALAMLAL